MRNVKGGGERFFSIGPKQNGSEGAHDAIVFRNYDGHKDLQAVYLPGSRISVELLPYDHGSPKLRSPVQNATLR